MVAFNLPARIVVSVGGEYTAQYVREDGRWWIKALKFVRRTLHSEHVTEDGSVSVPDFGKVSVDAAAHLFGTPE